MSWPVRILGTGAVQPATVVTAEDLDRRLGQPAGSCLARNGVRARHFVDASDTASAMSAAAIERALAAAGLLSVDLDAILFSGVMSEQPMPSTAVLIHRRLGARSEGVTCFDINASCVGFLKACEVAANGIAAGLWRRVAVVAAELASKGLNWNDLDTCTLFGDGAAAAILGRAEASDGSAFLAIRSALYSEGAEASVMAAGGSRFNIRTPPPSPDDYLFHMHGHRLLRLTQQHLPEFLEDLLTAAPDVALIVPHQASAIGLAFLQRLLAERGTPSLPFVDILAEKGNQVSASLPTALDRAIRTHRLERGSTALLIATGAGLALSGIVLRY
jgi:3-oxoacyl-[acyl-carrier-protein] synthase-3